MNSREYISITIPNPDPISHINLMISHPGFKMEQHSHAFYHINRIMEGSVTIVIDGRAHEIEAGCTVVLPPNLPHTLYSRGGYKQIGIDVECVNDSRGILSELESLCNSFTLKKIPLTDYSAREAMDRMKDILSNPTKGNIMRSLNIAESQILDLLEAIRNERGDSFSDRFNAMLSQHKPWQLSLSDMCRILCLSRTQLERRSKKAFGCGASEYCARLRYSMVCDLLRSDNTLEAIAEKTGFYDSCHLSRFFTSRAGMTPGQYRKIV